MVPNCPHHVVQRGHNRNAVFVTDQDYQYYLENLKEWKSKLAIKLYAWCLMTNHIHLIVEPGANAMRVSELMKRVNGRQSAYTNKLEGRSGSLWEGRYKTSPIQRETYLLNCCRYVELNPVRATMVNDPMDYPWSSYRERMGQVSAGLLDKDDLYMRMGFSQETRRQAYEEFVASGVSLEEKKFLTGSFQRNQLTGNSRFVDEVERRVGIRIENRGRGRPRSHQDEK